MYVTRSPGLTVNRAYMGLKISLEMITYHSLSNPPASWPSSPFIEMKADYSVFADVCWFVQCLRSVGMNVCTFKDDVETILPFIGIPSMKFSEGIFEYMTPADVNRQFLPANTLVHSLKFCSEITSFHVEI